MSILVDIAGIFTLGYFGIMIAVYCIALSVKYRQLNWHIKRCPFEVVKCTSRWEVFRQKLSVARSTPGLSIDYIKFISRENKGEVYEWEKKKK